MMPAKNEPDLLQKQYDMVQEWCNRNGAKLIQGFVEQPGTLPVVLWNEEGPDSLEHFLSFTKELGSTLVVANLTHLTREDWEATKEELTDESHLEENEEALTELRACESQIGYLASVELRTVLTSPPMLLKYDAFAGWFDLIYSKEVPDEADEWSEDIKEEQGRREQGEAFAHTLAKEPKFHQAQNKIQREYVARSLFKDDPAWNPEETYLVVNEAKLIYDTEVRPALEDALVERVRKLRNDGMTAKDIATELKLSVQKVKALID